jgi:MFS transporter, AAHS family, 4-hydroxybenzoate transporter
MSVSQESGSINISELVDNGQMGSPQIVLFGLCFLCLMMDGFDVQAIGYTAPALIQEWKIPNSALGPVFGAGNFGLFIGSLLFTMLADKIGRRPVLIGATLFFSLVTLLTARVTTVQALLMMRFAAGLGFGCIMPNATALIGEYSPRRLRIILMAVISVGFPVGAAIGGFIAAWLIPAYGWRSVFYLGGIVPLITAALMLAWLPESLQFLVLRGKQRSAITKWLKRIAPAVSVGPATRFIVPEENRRGMPVVHLFREGRAVGTLLIWTVNFMNLLNLFFLANWLPTVVRDSGYPTSTAVRVGAMLQVGGTLGALYLAWLAARRGFMMALITCFAIASITIGLIGQPWLSLRVLYLVVFITGACVLGGQAPLNALSGTFYPTYLRSTGIGWGLGFGRVGAIVGPVLAGEFMRLRWSTENIFEVAVIPAFISTIVMLSMRWVIKPQAASEVKTEIVAH